MGGCGPVTTIPNGSDLMEIGLVPIALNSGTVHHTNANLLPLKPDLEPPRSISLIVLFDC